MNSRPARLIVAALTATLALVGCGNSDEASSPSSAPSSEHQPTTATPPPSSARPDSPAPTTADSPTDTEPSAVHPSCNADELDLAVKEVPGGSDAQAVTSELTVNDPGAECLLPDIPIVTYQAAEGEIVGAPAAPVNGAGAEQDVVLAPADTRTATLREGNAEKWGEECQPRDTSLLAVALSDGGATAYLDHSVTACAATDIQLMTIGPWH